jgi:hypothetical protein
VCTGPLTGSAFSGANAPGVLPNPGNLNAAVTFRTASANTKATVDAGRVLSTADTDSNPITRDAGFSVQLASSPPRALWLFADTQQNHVGFIPYGSAAVGSFSPGQAPTSLNELPPPPTSPTSGLTAPAPFFPAPSGLRKLDGSPCGTSGTYMGDWATGAARKSGSSTLLLMYGEMCVETSPLAFTMERLVFAEYNPTTNAFVRIDRPFQASPLQAGLSHQRALGSPLFGSDGFLYLYAGDCQGAFCATKGAVYVARVAASSASWSNPASFQWWIGGNEWNSNSAAAANVLPNATPITGSVSVADYSAVGKNLIMVEQTGLGSTTFKVFQATSPTGPWTQIAAGQVPDACRTGAFGCYAVMGHAELSTSTQLVYSWFSPDDRDGYAHLRLGTLDW